MRICAIENQYRNMIVFERVAKALTELSRRRAARMCAAVTKSSTGAAAICGRGGVKSSQW